MKRKNGFYRVKNRWGRWEAAEWISEFGWWNLCGSELGWYDDDFKEIGKKIKME